MKALFPSLFLFTIVVTSPAYPAEVFKLHAKGETVFAGFSANHNTEACAPQNPGDTTGLFTQVFVFISNLTEFGEGPANARLGGFLTVRTFDFCSGRSVVNADGLFDLRPDDFHISPALRSANLRITVETLDRVSGLPILFSINMTWKGIGSIFHGRQIHSHETENGLHFNVVSGGSSREAVAVGTVVAAGSEFDYAIGPSVDADIGKYQVVNLTIAQ